MEIPLFPLHTVLFPGMPVNLHIFEKRYQLMINRCIDERQPFGVVLIQTGQEALGELAEPHLIGCTARILRVERLDQGRMNIACLGHERFRILSLDKSSYPYLVGQVELFPFPEESPQQSEVLGEQVRNQLKKFVDILSRIRGEEFQGQQLPENPTLLAYMAATLLQIPATEKQALLESENIEQFYRALSVILSREIVLLEAIASKSGPMMTKVFSKN
ncbi:MAG TPA: LON peptidase substrate-binding domain-containing protein [Anaerolineales bacterium]|nr:LON peptidase substrate-binding domain-containing protein [Anaerolineales bacterium]